MFNAFSTFCAILLTFCAFSQKKASAYEVKYDTYENEQKTTNPFSFYYDDGIVYLSKMDSRIQNYTDFKRKENNSTLTYDNKTYRKVAPFESLPKPSIEDRNKQLLGYNCRYAFFTYFSNKIEVWYTEEAPVKGSPYNNYLPSENALVLEISINGSLRMSIHSIEKVKSYDVAKRQRELEIPVNDAEFEELKINARYTKISVFENEIVNFDPNILPAQDRNLSADSVYHFSKGTIVLKKVKIPKELQKSEFVFAKLSCRSNGDAYDRTGSLFMIPVHDTNQISMLSAMQFGIEQLPVIKDNQGNAYQGIVCDENYSPVIEWMRFFTSFGAKHFNEKRQINNYNWEENVTYKQDISQLFPSNTDEIWVGIFVGNYDKGGHIVNLELDFYPSFEAPDSAKSEKFIAPLFSTLNILEMSGQNYGGLFGNDTLKSTFSIPENCSNLQLLYTSTGHGGWEGGDEFNPKMNRIFIDGKEIFSIVPWRTDCATYRFFNPASGNFENGLSSSDLSRSNWCPATLTPPYLIPLNNLKSGEHVIEVIIDQGKNEGNNSSHWNVSGILVGKLAH